MAIAIAQRHLGHRASLQSHSRAYGRAFFELLSGRSIFLTEGSTPRRGRRVLPVTLGHHHKPFGSARTARALRALDLVGVLHARTLAHRAPWGARKRRRSGSSTLHDCHHQRVLLP
eukprot:scaffold18068_cov62-Phaeocystis_antarctica.AAC.1